MGLDTTSFDQFKFGGLGASSSLVKVQESISDKAPGNRRAAVYPGSYCQSPLYTAALASYSLIRRTGRLHIAL